MKIDSLTDFRQLLALLWSGYREAYSPGVSVIQAWPTVKEDLAAICAQWDKDEVFTHVEISANGVDTHDNTPILIIWRKADWETHYARWCDRKIASDIRVAKYDRQTELVNEMRAIIRRHLGPTVGGIMEEMLPILLKDSKAKVIQMGELYLDFHLKISEQLDEYYELQNTNKAPNIKDLAGAEEDSAKA